MVSSGEISVLREPCSAILSCSVKAHVELLCEIAHAEGLHWEGHFWEDHFWKVCHDTCSGVAAATNLKSLGFLRDLETCSAQGK